MSNTCWTSVQGPNLQCIRQEHASQTKMFLFINEKHKIILWINWYFSIIREIKLKSQNAFWFYPLPKLYGRFVENSGRRRDG